MKKYVCDLDLGVGIHCKRKWLDEWRKLVTLNLNEMTQPNNGFSSKPESCKINSLDALAQNIHRQSKLVKND